jgi:hypothetical protein
LLAAWWTAGWLDRLLIGLLIAPVRLLDGPLEQHFEDLVKRP